MKAYFLDIIHVFVSIFVASFGYVPNETSFEVNIVSCFAYYTFKTYRIAFHFYYFESEIYPSDLHLMILNDSYKPIKIFKSTSVPGHIQNIKEAISWLKCH